MDMNGVLNWMILVFVLGMGAEIKNSKRKFRTLKTN